MISVGLIMYRCVRYVCLVLSVLADRRISLGPGPGGPEDNKTHSDTIFRILGGFLSSRAALHKPLLCLGLFSDASLFRRRGPGVPLALSPQGYNPQHGPTIYPPARSG